MAYRTLLVHLDADARCDARVRLALQLAAQHQSHVIGVCATGSLELPVGGVREGSLAADFIETGRRHFRERAQGVAQSFRQMMQDAGHEGFEVRVEECDAVQAVLRHAPQADLLILGQGGGQGDAAVTPIDQVARVLMRAGRPVLVLPAQGELNAQDNHVLVAWNGSRESTRAVADALPWLRLARQVDVVCFGEGRYDEPVRVDLNDLRAWLARHGVTAQGLVQEARGGVGPSLVSQAMQGPWDLLVMGGYGHSRAAEFLLGGATRSVLEAMPVQVMMSH